MLHHELLPAEGLLIVEPEGPLGADDFKKLTEAVDAHIAAHGGLKGLMLRAKSFPGWEDFAAFLSHMRFVRDHHRKIRRVAAVTDSRFLSIMPRIVDHFVSAEVRHFDAGDDETARAWLLEP